jgi:hypothetical protein
VPNVSFFASIRDQRNRTPPVVVRNTDNKENEAPIFIDPGYPLSPEPISITPRMENLKSKEQEGVRSELLKIVDDMRVRTHTTKSKLLQWGSHIYSPIKNLTMEDCKCTGLHMFGSEGELMKLVTLLSASLWGRGPSCIDLQAPSASFK